MSEEKEAALRDDSRAVMVVHHSERLRGMGVPAELIEEALGDGGRTWPRAMKLCLECKSLLLTPEPGTWKSRCPDDRHGLLDMKELVFVRPLEPGEELSEELHEARPRFMDLCPECTRTLHMPYGSTELQCPSTHGVVSPVRVPITRVIIP